MLKINKSLALLLFVALVIGNKGYAQNHVSARDIYMQSYVFHKDSLQGFDDVAARRAAISEGFTGPEFARKMFTYKRQYINAKYNITPQFIPYVQPIVAKTSVVPGCTNEDFEASTAGTITSNNAITGWSLSSGTNDQALTGATSCNLLGCCPGTTSASAIFTTPFVDPVIGSQYQIYSVFGTATTNSAAAAATNTQISQPMLGNKVIRINNPVTNDYGIERLAKTFAVTQTNALFQFAFISVFATGHLCCDAGSFRIRLLNASGGNTLIPCPTFSVAAPGANCAAGVGTPAYLNAANSTGTGLTPGGPVTSASSYIYNPWQINSVDLTPYIGSNITLEIIITDCDQGGHFGYCYFDAQCGPMTIYGNGTPYGAGTTTATVPTCGATGATLCAVDGLGPFSWAGPGLVPPYTVPSLSNQCYTTNISGTFTLYMNPAGSCAPIARVISTTITPAPLLAASVIQAVCGSTTAIVTLTPSGSASIPSTITYTPTPLTISGNTLSATYAIPSGTNPAYGVTVTASDPLGCLVTATTQVNPAAPIPTFTLNNVSGTSSITCAHSFVELQAVTNYTYGTLSYTFSGAAGSPTVTDDLGLYVPGVYTIIAQDPTSQCAAIQHYTVGLNMTPPSVAVTPTNQNVTCSTGIITVTLSAISPTINIVHNIWTPGGFAPIVATNPTVIYQPGTPGNYADTLCNLVNGCCTVRNFSVSSNDHFPSLSVTSPQSFTLGCSNFSVATINLNGQSFGGGVAHYALFTPSTGTNFPAPGIITTYTTITAGNYTALAIDPTSSCITTVPFSIIANNFGPDLAVDVPLSILSCYTRTTQLVGITANTHAGHLWSYHGPNGIASSPGASLVVSTNTNVNSPLVDTFTLTTTDIINKCVSTRTVTILQNQYPPKSLIATSSTVITCSSPNTQLNNNSTTNIPPSTGFPTNQAIVGALWQGPTPQTPATFTTNYQAFTPGVYTLTAMDNNNGCTSFTTITIGDNRIYPIITASTLTVLDCGANNTTLVAATTATNPSSLSYNWYPPASSQISGTNTHSVGLLASSSGDFPFDVTNPNNGCTSNGLITVTNGQLTADFTPDVSSGYAPLTVNFTNNSHSSVPSIATLSINSVWNYGNGVSSSSLIAASPYNGSAVYTQPGTYQVTLFVRKGSCQEVVTKTITVDIPSSLTVPNVFTPNGDGINDLFFLKVANMTEITANIFDRWGRKVYELTSETGNIAWDGTNMVGTKVAAGVYFYTIKGTGKDGQSYDTKGTITLYK